MIDEHDDDCPIGLTNHIAEIEAGWTLRKWWKVEDEHRAIEENRQEVQNMLDRWRTHGIEIR